MAYASRDFQTKKQLRDAVLSGQHITVQAGLFGQTSNGNVALEGPWYPKPHRWYATATVEDGRIVKVR